jgi:bifunctional DNase/RNase
MKKIELYITALSHSVTQSHNYAVVLGAKDSNRRLPIIIGGFEAQSIAVAMENMTPNRPLTHDLIKSTLDTFDIKLTEVLINNLLDGIFYARLVCEKDGQVVEIDSRTSDAIALAVRFNCPIYTFEFILDAAGVILEDPDEEMEENPAKPAKTTRRSKNPNDMSGFSSDELASLLEEALSNEDYEKAAKLRDELNNRKSLGQ